MTQMYTYSGKFFDPMNLTTDDITIEDIAHALSLLCRGGGHLNWFYSVCQHSIYCAREAEARNHSKRVVLACLLHDASEAYISDIIRPVKSHLTNYKEIETMIMDIILEKYGLKDLTEEETRQWKQIDDDMLKHEMVHLMSRSSDANPEPLRSNPDFTQQSCNQMEETFLSMFEALTK